MAKSHDDYDDYDDHGSKGSKSSYRSDSASSHRENFGKTSNFSTMLSDDGRFFGVSLSPDLKGQLEKIYPIALPIITEKAEAAASKILGNKYGSAVGWGIALSEQIYKVGENLFTSTKSANDLRVAMQPLARANSQAHQIAPLSGTNEVIANARGKISNIFWQRMVDTAVSTIGAAPAILMKVNQHAKGNAAVNLQKEMEEAAGDINKIKEIQERRLNGTSIKDGSTKTISAKDMRAANALIIEEREAEYIAKYKKYAETRKAAMTKELEEALALTPDNYLYKAKDLEKFGIPTESLKKDMLGKQVWDAKRGQYYHEAPKTVDDEKAIIEKFIQNVKGTATAAKKGGKSASTGGRNMDRTIDEAMRYEYAKREGAWDETWRPASERKSGDREDPTLKSQYQSDFKKLEEENRKLESEVLAAEKGQGKGGHGKKDDMREVSNALWGLGASITREVAGKLFGGTANEQYKKPLALDRILHLRRSVEQPKDKPDWTPPDEVPPIPSESRKAESREKSMGYAQFVHEIFQQHQRDSKRVEIGDRFFQNFEKARWSDEKINQIPDDQLSAYELAVKTIAKRIKDGRMDALALVELVGDPTRKIVQNDARTFGPQGTGKDEKDAKEAILKLIDEKTALLHTAQEKTEEQVNDKLSNFVFSVDDMKKALESDVLDKEQRAFVFTMFSDVVGSDVKLCKKLGISTERCIELRKESQEHMNQTLDSVVAVLADVIEQSPEAIEKNLNITDKEKSLIKNLAKQEKQEGKHAVDLTKDREEMERLKTISANATMMLAGSAVLEGEGKPSFWQRVKNSIEDFKNPKPKAESKPHNPSARMDDSEFDGPKPKSSSSHSTRDKHDDFADDFDKPSKPKSSSYKSHDPFDHDTGYDMDSRKSKSGRHSDHDMDHEHTSRFSDREDSRHPERSGTGGRYADRFASRHSDKGEHGKKWSDEHKRDDDDFGGRIRRNRLESETETGTRGGIV